jgi:tetratricopeptide (TPR) repeat protein
MGVDGVRRRDPLTTTGRPGYSAPMAPIILRATLASVLALTFVSGTWTAWAQAPQMHSRAAGPPLPKTPAEREKVLSDLYAHLAAATDEESAKAVADAIERLWLNSGSDTIDLLMERSMKAVSDKNLELALTLLNYVVELAPDFTEGWNRRAYVHYMQSEIDLALGDLRRALALDPNHFKALDGFAQILREIGQKKPALKAFKQLLDVHPYWSGAQEAVDELAREVEGQGI